MHPVFHLLLFRGGEEILTEWLPGMRTLQRIWGQPMGVKHALYSRLRKQERGREKSGQGEDKQHKIMRYCISKWRRVDEEQK